MIEIYDFEQIYHLGRNLDIENNNGNEVFQGFTYFVPNDTVIYEWNFKNGQKTPIFFVIKIDNTVVGVLKLGHYIRPNYDFYAINYVDVHRKYRKQGIGTKLYLALNEWGKNKDVVVVGSMLSDEGKQAKLYSLRKTLLTDVKTFNEEQDYYDFLLGKLSAK